MLGSTHCLCDRFIPWNLFFYPTNCESLAAFRLSGQHILCEFNWNVVWMKKPRLVYMFRKSLKIWFQKKFLGLVICFVFTKEIAFKHFLFLNIAKFRFVLFFSDEADMKRWNSFKDYEEYIIILFRLSHTLHRNLTELVYVRIEKNSKLKIFISSLFPGKKVLIHEI